MMQAITYAVAVAGLVVVLGYCGQISLAQAAFFGLGAYGVAIGARWICNFRSSWPWRWGLVSLAYSA